MNTRRQFLKSTTLGLGVPMIIPASALGLGKHVSANERVQLATIGVANRGLTNQRGLAKDERVEIVAVCDVDQTHREKARAEVKLPAAAADGDFREVLQRKDVDAVMVATPDHWHGHIAVAAARAGKDIYCEKPLTASIGEGRILADVVKREKRVLQCGTQRRSMAGTRRACELVRNSYLGELKTVEVGVPGKFAIRGGYSGLEPVQPVPPSLDFEMWQGPAPKAPYTAARVHFNFRWVNEYAPGYITDWGAHFIDVVQWANNMDASGPVEVTVLNQTRRPKGAYNAPERFHIDYRYANGVRMTMKTETDPAKWGITFTGTEGTLFSEGQRLRTTPAALQEQQLKPTDTRLYMSDNHYRNFIDCVYSRKPTAATAETGHRSASACYLGAIATEVGGTLEFDPAKEQFTNNPHANRHLMKTMRAPWKLT